MSHLEALATQAEIIRRETNFAEEIANLKLAKIAFLKESEDKHLEILTELGDSPEAQEEFNTKLRKEIPKLWWQLISAEPSDTLAEINPVRSPNGITYWRELDIAGFGRIDVSYVKDADKAEGASHFALEEPNLPIVVGRRRAETMILAEFQVDQPLRGTHNIFSENVRLLGLRQTLQELCEAAGTMTAEKSEDAKT